MIPTNFSDGGVFESTLRFQIASPASLNPALRPTRGSGFGATVDIVEVESRVTTRRSGQESDGERQGSESGDRCHCGLPWWSLGMGRGRECGKHSFHTGYFGRLIDVDVRGKLENRFVLARAVGAEQLLDHGRGATMVLDHEGEE